MANCLISRKPLDFFIQEFAYLLGWWRRRESNPRPKALYSEFYILSQVIYLAMIPPTDRLNHREFPVRFNLSPGNPSLGEPI